MIAKQAKAALLASLQTQIAPADPDTALLICYDTPGTYRPPDIIAVGAVTREITTAGMAGSMTVAGTLHVAFSIDVIVSVYRGGDDAQAVWERADDLVEDVITAVRADPTLGGAVLLAFPDRVDQPVADWEASHNGRVCECHVAIACTALI